jgi:hypothetical protein
MERIRKVLAIILCSAAVLSFWSGCTKEEVYEAAHIKATFRLRSPSAMSGKLRIDEAYLKLSHIDVTGTRQGKKNTNLTHGISPEEPPYQLSRADSSQISFNLPYNVYDQLDFHLFLFRDTYQLIIKEENKDAAEPDGEGNTGGEQEDGEKDDDKDSGNQDDDKDQGDRDDHEDKGDDDDQDDEGDKDKDHKDKGHDDKKDKGNHDDKGNKDKKDKGNKGHGNDDDKNKNDDDDDDDNDDDGRTSGNKNQTVDIDHFFQNAKPGMVVISTYQNNAKTLKVIFIAEGISKLTLVGKQNDSPGIMLNKQNTAEITFNPEHWFQSITDDDIESAHTQIYHGQAIVFIHKDYNNHLFEAIAPAIQASAELNFTALSDEMASE